MTCTPHLERPSTYRVRYACECGWQSTEADSTDFGVIGRELVAHMSGGRIPHTPPRPEPNRRRRNRP